MQPSDSSFTPTEIVNLLRLINTRDDQNIRLALAICEGGGDLPAELLKKISSEPRLILYCLEEGHQKILSAFRFIYIRWASLSAIPPNIKYLQNVLMLDFGYNKISEIHKDLYTLAQLKKLRFHKNQLRQISHEIADLIYLEELDLSANFIERLPTEINHLQQLKKLILTDNPLDAKQMDSLSIHLPHTCIVFE